MIHRPGILLLIVALAGCSPSQLARVSGSVQLDGQPLTRGTVTLHPVESGRPAYGTIDGAGNFRVEARDGEGLPPGDYIATVVALEPASLPTDGDMPMPGKNLAPSRYSEPQSSGLEYDLKAGDNQLTLELVSE